MHKKGGLRLALEYCRMGLGWKIAKRVCWSILHGKPLKNVYYYTIRMVGPVLLKKYESLLQQRIETYSAMSLTHERAKIVWFCWLQGKDNLPDIVRACYNSQLRNIADREFRFIDGENWREYVSIPDYLVAKYEKGAMPAAMFSDLIRLELLIKYGGTWIDATVLSTGGHNTEVLDADLFMYRYGKNQGFSNWFISSYTNNPMLMVIRDVLYQYWKDYDVVLDYYIFHLLFGRLTKEYPELMERMPYAKSYLAISLVHNWNKPYRQTTWDRVTAEVPFHKLAWKVKKSTIKNKDNYYNYIISNYLLNSHYD